MNAQDLFPLSPDVNDTIEAFQRERLSILSTLDVGSWASENLYRFRSQSMVCASDIVKQAIAAFLSSSDEEMLGMLLKNLAMWVCMQMLGGRKSALDGVDLEFTGPGNAYYVVAIRPTTNWGNTTRHAMLAEDLRQATQFLLHSQVTRSVEPVLGICSGRTRTTRTPQGYLTVVGQNFWALISGNRELYKEIPAIINYRAKQHNEAYEMERSRIENLLTARFLDEYCLPDGNIDWEKLVETSSKNYDLDQVLGLNLA